MPRSWPTRSQATSSGTRQSTPITSPPASARSSSRCASPVAKWIVGTSTAARIARGVRRARTRGNRPTESAPTHESKSWITSAPARTQRGDVRREGLGQLLHQRVPDVGLRVHARLRQLEVARRLALDQVAGDGERPAREADHALVGPKRLADQPDRLQHERHRLLRLGHAQALDVGKRPHRLGDHGPDVLDQLDVDAHPEDGQHDVREHHGRVDVVRAAPAGA